MTPALSCVNVTIAVFVVCAAPVQGQDANQSIEIGVDWGVERDVTDPETRVHAPFGWLRAAFPASMRVSIEPRLLYSPTSNQPLDDVRFRFQLGVLLQTTGSTKLRWHVRPYAGLTVGEAGCGGEIPPCIRQQPVVGLAVGVRYFGTRRFALRLEPTIDYTFDDDGFRGDAWIVGAWLGVSYFTR
jgi:hypothetical protein